MNHTGQPFLQFDGIRPVVLVQDQNACGFQLTGNSIPGDALVSILGTYKSLQEHRHKKEVITLEQPV